MLSEDTQTVETLFQLFKVGQIDSKPHNTLYHLLIVLHFISVHHGNLSDDTNLRIYKSIIENRLIKTLLPLFPRLDDDDSRYRAFVCLKNFIVRDYKSTNCYERSIAHKGYIFEKLAVLIETAEKFEKKNYDSCYANRDRDSLGISHEWRHSIR